MAMEPVPMTVGRFWRFLTLGVGLGYTLKLALSGYHDLRNSWQMLLRSSGGGISQSLSHHPQAEYSATKDVPSELRYV
nr:hypothetical protein CFP56_62604 [Quercus suber]